MEKGSCFVLCEQAPTHKATVFFRMAQLKNMFAMSLKKTTTIKTIKNMKPTK